MSLIKAGPWVEAQGHHRCRFKGKLLPSGTSVLIVAVVFTSISVVVSGGVARVSVARVPGWVLFERIIKPHK